MKRFTLALVACFVAGTALAGGDHKDCKGAHKECSHGAKGTQTSFGPVGLAPSVGTYLYADPNAHQNGADIFPCALTNCTLYFLTNALCFILSSMFNRLNTQYVSGISDSPI